MSVEMESVALRTLEKIRNRTTVVGVVGLGYVGLPFLVEKEKFGFSVVGIDRKQERRCGGPR